MPAGKVAMRSEVAGSETNSSVRMDSVNGERFDQTSVTEALSVKNIEKALESANDALKSSNNSLRFQVDKSVRQPIISVVDQDSGKILRQYPTEEIVRITKNIDSLRGVLFDSKS